MAGYPEIFRLVTLARAPLPLRSLFPRHLKSDKSTRPPARTTYSYNTPTVAAGRDINIQMEEYYTLDRAWQPAKRHSKIVQQSLLVVIACLRLRGRARAAQVCAFDEAAPAVTVIDPICTCQ